MKDEPQKDEPQYASQPGHRDYDHYMSLKSKFEKMHGDLDIDGATLNHNATSAALRAFKENISTMDRNSDIDGVVLSRSNDRHADVAGRYAILYQGDPNSPTVRTLAIPTQELTQPAERNLQEINRINDHNERHYARALERQETHQVSQELEQQNKGSRSLV
jgi:hypothetical protein